MERRTLLAGVVALAGGMAGCGTNTGQVRGTAGIPTRPEDRSADRRSPLVIDDFRFERATDGTLVIVTTIWNQSSETASGLVTATVAVADRSVRETVSVTVASGRTKTVRLPMDVSYETFREDRNVDFTIDYGE
jgi:hypothetical protein